jgi:hypothetical protein
VISSNLGLLNSNPNLIGNVTEVGEREVSEGGGEEIFVWENAPLFSPR